MTVFRGVLGTQSVAHEIDELVRKIDVIPSEVHRFSAIRASGHTFEYIGYGAGNYSTSLPQKIERNKLNQKKNFLQFQEKRKVESYSSLV